MRKPNMFNMPMKNGGCTIFIGKKRVKKATPFAARSLADETMSRVASF
jgi:hypothetical protein